MDKYCQKNPELQKKSQLDEKMIARIKEMVQAEVRKRLFGYFEESVSSLLLESLSKGDDNE